MVRENSAGNFGEGISRRDTDGIPIGIETNSVRETRGKYGDGWRSGKRIGNGVREGGNSGMEMDSMGERGGG